MNPTRQFPSKNQTLKFLSKCPYLTRTNTWMFCPRSVLIGFLGVADIFAPDFLLFCRQFFERNFQIPTLKQKCVDLNCWVLNSTAIGWLRGGALSKTESVLRVKLLFMVTVWRASSCLAERFFIETRNLSYSELWNWRFQLINASLLINAQLWLPNKKTRI